METMGVRGRTARVGVTLLAGALLLAGSIWGDDDEFPFGPFRMYASVPDLDAPARDTRVEATDAAGATVLLTEKNTGIRRAEVEGQMDRFRRDPALLSVVATAYARRHQRAAALSQVRIVVRWHDMKDGRPTGAWHDEVVTTWAP
jgi:hypothetical protein